MSKCVYFLFFVSSFLMAHSGHEVSPGVWQENTHSLVNVIGRYHYMFVHFPIALIVMTVIAEGLAVWTGKEVFSHAARVMIIAAAIWAVPTALLGLALGYGSMYEGVTEGVFLWHRGLGLGTAALAVTTVILREKRMSMAYYVSLTFLFVCLCWTTILGGELTFNF